MLKAIENLINQMLLSAAERNRQSAVQRMEDGRHRRDKYQWLLTHGFAPSRHSSDELGGDEQIYVFGEHLTHDEMEREHKVVLHEIDRDNSAYEKFASRCRKYEDRIALYERVKGYHAAHSN